MSIPSRPRSSTSLLENPNLLSLTVEQRQDAFNDSLQNDNDDSSDDEDRGDIEAARLMAGLANIRSKGDTSTTTTAEPTDSFEAGTGTVNGPAEDESAPAVDVLVTAADARDHLMQYVLNPVLEVSVICLPVLCHCLNFYIRRFKLIQLGHSSVYNVRNLLINQNWQM